MYINQHELQKKTITHLEDSLQIELLDLPLQPGGKARVHGRPTGQHWKPGCKSRSNLEVKEDCQRNSLTNVFVKFRPHVDVSRLDCREDQLGHTWAKCS